MEPIYTQNNNIKSDTINLIDPEKHYFDSNVTVFPCFNSASMATIRVIPSSPPLPNSVFPDRKEHVYQLWLKFLLAFKFVCGTYILFIRIYIGKPPLPIATNFVL